MFSKFLFTIIVLTFLTRFYALGVYPPGPYDDEAALGYNAYSILKTGKDEFGNFLPLAFRSFDDYKSPFYIYSIIPSILIFDLNVFSTRVPSALFGTLSVLILYFLTKQITKNEKIALYSAFFMSISTWHTHFTRGAFEAVSMLFLTLIGIVVFLKFIQLNSLFYLVISALVFSLGVYSYQGAKVLIPLVITCLLIVYKNNFNLKKNLVFIITLLLFCAPLLIDIKNTTLRGRSVSVFSQNQPIYETISGYLHHLSADYLFIDGDQHGRHNVFGLGQLHVFQIPILILGIYVILKNYKNNQLLLSLLLIAPIPAAISIPSPHAIRSIFMIVPLSIILALGVKEVLRKHILFRILIFIVFSYNIFTYFHLYYFHYAKMKSTDWQEGYEALFNNLISYQNNSEKIYITNYHGNPYIFTLFFTKYDPALYQAQKNKNFVENYFFTKPENPDSKNTLFVTTAWEQKGNTVLKEIYNGNNELKFIISENQ